MKRAIIVMKNVPEDFYPK